METREEIIDLNVAFDSVQILVIENCLWQRNATKKLSTRELLGKSTD